MDHKEARSNVSHLNAAPIHNIGLLRRRKIEDIFLVVCFFGVYTRNYVQIVFKKHPNRRWIKLQVTIDEHQMRKIRAHQEMPDKNVARPGNKGVASKLRVVMRDAVSDQVFAGRPNAPYVPGERPAVDRWRCYVYRIAFMTLPCRRLNRFSCFSLRTWRHVDSPLLKNVRP